MSEEDAYMPPITIVIPLPSQMPRSRGRHSTGKKAGNTRIRISDFELQAIKREADHLGLSVSHFIRWCAVFAARGLLNAREGK